MEELKKAIATSKATTEILEHINDQIRWATERIDTDKKAINQMQEDPENNAFAIENRKDEIENEKMHIQALKEIAKKVTK